MVALSVVLAAALAGCGGGGHHSSETSTTPNILFVIMDDVGIDQMASFGYGGATPPSMPNITALANGGIRFHNTWAMPACSTSRSVFFDGRFPLRTNVLGALGPQDLANSMVSPYEVTVPKLLAPQGYTSALFGKFHLGLQGNNPAGLGMVHDLGWNYFAGWLDETGDPSSIDTTAGGVAPAGTWPCGFVPGARDGGADSGACYMADGSCRAVSTDGPTPPGRTCRDAGGIFDPNNACQTPPPSYLNFEELSAHYVSPYDINNEDGSVEAVPPTDPRARRYRAAQAVDDAIAWINARPAHKPWMATVSFASSHTPLMQPPIDELTDNSPSDNDLDCSNEVDQRVLMNLMDESLDHEVGRLLVAVGLAHTGGDGHLIYQPEKTDTMIVVIGDNGSLGVTVKPPFDVSRSKGSPYQTGVWVPLVVSGPLVSSPGRIVSSMINVADLFSLFGEIAGIADVQQVVPRQIDAMPMLPYLRDPDQASIREWNFTQIGTNLQANGTVNGPCVISGGCTQIPVSKSVCEDNNGVWWGAGADDPTTTGIPPEGLALCCNVNAFRASEGESLYSILPPAAVAIRNDHYKIVENFTPTYVSQEEPCVDMTTFEFYQINEDVPVPLLDRDGTELPLDALTPEQQTNYDALSAQLQAILDSEPDCPGDGNIDSVVDQLDLDDWQYYSSSYGLSSVYDLNLDGVTDEADESIIQENLGLTCPSR